MKRKSGFEPSLVLVAALVLGGCGAGDHAAATPSAVGKAAPWAQEVATGDELWQVSSEGLTLTAYAMGEDTAEYDSYAADDETNELLVVAGDPIMFVNLVLTNNGDEVRYLTTRQPMLVAAPRESPYMRQGVAEITRASSAQWESHNLSYESLQKGSSYHSPFALAPGESCARGFILPLKLGHEWGFVGSVWVFGGVDEHGLAADSGRAVRFDTRYYTFN